MSPMGENKSNKNVLFISNNGGQKKVTQYFLNVKRKELSSINSIAGETFGQERRRN